MRIELLLFLSLLAVIVVMAACSMSRRTTPVLSPTLFPRLTLTTYDPQVTGRIGGEPSMAATILPARPRFREIEISPPRCYDTIAPRVTCLGYLRNLGEGPLSDVRLRAHFRGADGVSQGETQVTLEQRRIAAGEAAPYRLDLPRARLETLRLELEAGAAEISAAARPTFGLVDAAGDYDPLTNRYRLDGLLINESAQPAADIRLIVTLEDDSGALLAYRALDLPGQLPRGATIGFDLALTPLVASGSLRHRVIAQARFSAQP